MARRDALAGVAVGLLVVPVFSPGAGWGGGPLVVAALAVATGTASVMARIGRTTARRFAGALIIAAAAVVFGAVPLSVLTLLAAATLGVGVGALVPPGALHRRSVYATACAWALVLALAASLTSGSTALWLAVVAALVCASATPVTSTSEGARGGPLVLGAAWLLAAGLVGFVGASDPSIQWFGAVVDHGSRASPLVSVTFDDGPDAGYTLKIASILERYGVRGTFFSVGKAVDRLPAVSRELIARGHLIGNHSYEHDQWRWLDPTYPELARAQQAIKNQTGVCPTFYRPPHGQRTPLLLKVVRDHAMTTVLWDVSAGDWNAHDPAAVAAKVLKNVKPGSIIDLHDGLDGNPGADRSVLVKALPMILDGLKSKGLRPVRLDELLHRAPYTGRC